MLSDPQVIITLQHAALALLQVVVAVATYYLGKHSAK